MMYTEGLQFDPGLNHFGILRSFCLTYRTHSFFTHIHTAEIVITPLKVVYRVVGHLLLNYKKLIDYCIRLLSESLESEKALQILMEVWSKRRYNSARS